MEASCGKRYASPRACMSRGAEAPGLTSPQTPDFSPGEFGCLAHRPIFIAMTALRRAQRRRQSQSSTGPAAGPAKATSTTNSTMTTYCRCVLL